MGSKDVRKYELVVVYDPSLTDAELDQEAAEIKRLLEKFSASEILADRWGRRDLAYMTKKRRSGIYVAYYFQCADGNLFEELNGALRISDNVLLFQSHKVNDAKRKFQGRFSMVEKDAEQRASA